MSSRLEVAPRVIFHYLKGEAVRSYWRVYVFEPGDHRVQLTISPGASRYCASTSTGMNIALSLPERDRIFVQFWDRIHKAWTEEIELEDFRVEPYMDVSYRQLQEQSDRWRCGYKFPLDNSGEL